MKKKMTGMQIKDVIENNERKMKALEEKIKQFEDTQEKGSAQHLFTGKCLVIFQNPKHKEYLLQIMNAPNLQNAALNALIRPF